MAYKRYIDIMVIYTEKLQTFNFKEMVGALAMPTPGDFHVLIF